MPKLTANGIPDAHVNFSHALYAHAEARAMPWARQNSHPMMAEIMSAITSETPAAAATARREMTPAAIGLSRRPMARSR